MDMFVTLVEIEGIVKRDTALCNEGLNAPRDMEGNIRSDENVGKWMRISVGASEGGWRMGKGSRGVQHGGFYVQKFINFKTKMPTYPKISRIFA